MTLLRVYCYSYHGWRYASDFGFCKLCDRNQPVGSLNASDIQLAQASAPITTPKTNVINAQHAISHIYSNTAATPFLLLAQPSAGAQQNVPDQSSQLQLTDSIGSLGLFLGDEIMPIPQKIVRKFLTLEFVEMRLLLFKSWISDLDSSSHCCHSKHENKKQSQVTNIFTWLKCYGAMVGILASRYPQKVAELMAYQSTIIKCHTDFEGVAWVTYDRAYHRQAAVRKHLTGLS